MRRFKISPKKLTVNFEHGVFIPQERITKIRLYLKDRLLSGHVDDS